MEEIKNAMVEVNTETQEVNTEREGVSEERVVKLTMSLREKSMRKSTCQGWRS